MGEALYRITLRITEFPIEKLGPIMEACLLHDFFSRADLEYEHIRLNIGAQETDFHYLEAMAEESLPSDLNAEYFSTDLTHAVWAAAGEFCEISTYSIPLDCIEWDVCRQAQGDYEEWLEEKRSLDEEGDKHDDPGSREGSSN